MKNETLEAVEYKNCTIEIYQDIDADSPEGWGDSGMFLVGFHREFSVSREGFSEGMIQSMLSGGKYEDESINHEAVENLKKYHIFILEAYIHSGVSLSLAKESNIDRSWDVSTLGAVLVAKTEARTRQIAEKLARGLIASWNDYLSGNIHGYVSKDEYGNDINSCWGFYGDYKEMIEEAKTEIDYYIKNTLPSVKAMARMKEERERHNVNLLDLSGSENEAIRRNAISLIKLLRIK